MKRSLSILFVIIVFFVLLTVGQAAAAEAQKDKALLDPTSNYIYATGMAVAPEGKTGAQAKALARRGAIVDLQRLMLEYLVGVQIDSRTTVNDFMADDRVRSEIHGCIRNIELLDGKWDGESYEIEGRLPMPNCKVIVESARGPR